MKALVYTEPCKVVYREEPDPIQRPSDVLIKVEAVGICGSDMHAYHGHDPRRVPPLILGHEVAGTILDGEKKGCRAVINPLITCGKCDYCTSGRSNLCLERELIGMRLPGAFAQFVSISSKNIVMINERMNAVKASVAEPAATALHALNLAKRMSYQPLSEFKTLVLGGGAVGLLAALLLRSDDCSHIVLSEINKFRRDSARDAAGCQVHDPIHDPELAEDTFDLVIDAVGGAATRKTALKVVKPGGIILHIGLMDAKGELDIRKLTLAEITLIGVYTYTRTDIKKAVDMLQKEMLGPLDWVEVRSLSDGAQAFDDLDKGRTSAAKIVLIPD